MGKRILVIKLSALGDFVQALGPFKAIREHHAGDRITLLTTKPYAAFAAASPYFDEVWIDEKAPRWRLDKMAALGKKLKGGRFDRVYDLQTSGRSSSYFKLFSPKPEWSGIASGCSHPHANPKRDFMHTMERQAEQLAMAGIAKTPTPDLSWVKDETARFKLPKRFVLLVPGGAPHRPDKRWPAENYGELARRLEALPVILGTETERADAETILSARPDARDLLGQTTFADIACLARKAEAAVGNDTGPMHLIAAAGCKSLVLYSQASDPALCAQRGKKVTIIRKERLEDVGVDEVGNSLP